MSKDIIDLDIINPSVKRIVLEYRVIGGENKRIDYKVNHELFINTYHGTLDELKSELKNKYKNLFPLNTIVLIESSLDKY